MSVSPIEPVGGSRYKRSMAFIHLRVHSAYSLAEGALKIEDIPPLCHKLSMPAVAITDSNNLFGALEFAIACTAQGTQPIIGSLVQVLRPEEKSANNTHTQPIDDQLLLLAQNETGYRNLLALSSAAYMTPPIPGHPIPHISFEMLAQHAEGIIALTGGRYGALFQLLSTQQTSQAQRYLATLQEIFQNRLYIELMRHEIPGENTVEEELISLAFQENIPLVATNDVFFATPEMYEAHDALLCIAAGRVVDEEDRRRLTPHHYFKSAEEMKALFADIPEAIENTIHIAQRCSYRPAPCAPILPKFPTPHNASEAETLRAEAAAGLEMRLQQPGYVAQHTLEETEHLKKQYYQRLQHELDIIETMGFPGYFLIVSDFIQWAKRQGIPVGPGRGSGAGSIVAWALTITDIDPIRFSLLFERFLNPERVSMPDFDIDFCQDRRDEVIRYVTQRYGATRVAHIITFGKLQARAVLRDVGRVLQLPYGQVDRISKLIPHNPANPVSLEQALIMEPALAEARDTDLQVKRLIKIGLQLEGLYRHASTHAAGIVIADRPLPELIPIYKDDRSDLPVTQFNMKCVEMAGLVKFDFLGLKTLTVIEHCCQLLRERGIDINIGHISLEDTPTFELLGRVETVGLFQVESAGMRDVLKKLKPDRFEDLIALVALYRPGPMDDIPRYLACKHGTEEISYLHPKLEPILDSTYGVMVYQEQVMQIAQELGGYTLGAADLLRRAMGKKIQSEMDAQEALFVEGAIANGIQRPIAKTIFDQMAKFAGYGFNKSHSAPYALLTYQTAYLKANYPLEFFASSMTHDMHNTDKLNIFRQDMMRAQIPMLPPDINHSFATFTVESSGIRYALAAIKNVGEQAIKMIVAEREKNGPFQDVSNFFTRVDPKALNKRQLEHLVSAGAFDSLHSNRKELINNIDPLMRMAQEIHKQRTSRQRSLFNTMPQFVSESLKLIPCSDWPSVEKLQKEFEALGFFLSAHPLDIYGNLLAKQGITPSHALPTCTPGKSYHVAGVLLAKQERLSKTGHKFAFIQVSDPSGVFEVGVFSDTFTKSRDFLVPGQSLMLKVTIRFDEEDWRLTAQDIRTLDAIMQTQEHTLILQCTQELDVDMLKSALEQCSKGPARFQIRLTLPSGTCVTIKGFQSYTFTQETRSQLLTIPGVESLS